MLESAVLISFAALLVGSIIVDVPLALALVGGFVLFFGYGLVRGCKVRELLDSALEGPRSLASILALFAVIGMLTASWRAAGTIPAITSLSASVATPSTLVLASFVLCGLMSMLTGSSFATGATVGVICMTIARAMGMKVAIIGGAILSGAFVGERCSPLASTTNLIARLTHTELSQNLGRLARVGIVPLAASLAIYAILGTMVGGSPDGTSFSPALAQSFDLSWYVLMPIVVILALSLMRVRVMPSMLASLACALVICVGVQHVDPATLPACLVFGYHAADPSIAQMVDGGGITSMLDVMCIVAIASTYSGLFETTGLLSGLKQRINAWARKTTPFIGVLLSALVTCVISCDQIVSLMLTTELCDQTERSGEALALDLTNSATVLPAVIPWTTTFVGISSFVGMPTASIAYACFCYLVPLWTLVLSVWQRSHPWFVHSQKAYLYGLDGRDDARLAA